MSRFACFPVRALAWSAWGGGNLTPAHLAVDRPLAIACVVDRWTQRANVLDLFPHELSSLRRRRLALSRVLTGTFNGFWFRHRLRPMRGDMHKQHRSGGPGRSIRFPNEPMNDQLLAGCSKNTMSGGLEGHMPDYNDLERR